MTELALALKITGLCRDGADPGAGQGRRGRRHAHTAPAPHHLTDIGVEGGRIQPHRQDLGVGIASAGGGR
mgnify:CR=1 FL=1